MVGWSGSRWRGTNTWMTSWRRASLSLRGRTPRIGRTFFIALSRFSAESKGTEFSLQCGCSFFLGPFSFFQASKENGGRSETSLGSDEGVRRSFFFGVKIFRGFLSSSIREKRVLRSFGRNRITGYLFVGGNMDPRVAFSLLLVVGFVAQGASSFLTFSPRK